MYGYFGLYSLRSCLFFCLCFCLLLISPLPVISQEYSDALSWKTLRQNMVLAIEEDVASTVHYINKEHLDPRVMQAMSQVPRHEFVPLPLRLLSYKNRPLAIGYGQTISQPFIVALMTDLLNPKPEHRVLEIGTGSGYQAAILAQLVKKVYSIEIIQPLADAAGKRLDKLKINNIKILSADGFYGWQEFALFDAIIVTAVGGQIPPPLLQQLKPGGRMVLPVGDPFSVQYLLLVEKSQKGELTSRQVLPVRFVPLTGQH
ncbi:MAG: protein-L-isoaspartate(D-aspartate) O-methyltransferase [Pseudomonadales bacterium]|nr:protein-L-isoaspartate(D-aspartate) O-methyltransferase [Pseudomonadales bacterium]